MWKASVVVTATVVALTGTFFALTRPTDSNMPSLSQVRELNKAVSLLGKQAVVVGGTSGIGKAVALRLASAKASVTIVGRNPERGAAIVEEMTRVGDKAAKYDFVACDAQLLGNVRACAKDLDQRAGGGGVNLLVLSQGIATTQGRTPTSEGIDQKLALHYFSRVAFVRELLPALKRAEDARVLSVLSAGVHSPYQQYKEDFELENFSLKKAADAAGFYNDIALDVLSKENPDIAFIHQAPGFVATSWGTELPWLLRGAVRCIQVFAKKPADCAEYMVHGLISPDFSGGFHLLNEHAGTTSKTSLHDEARETVWAKTTEIVDRVIPPSQQ